MTMYDLKNAFDIKISANSITAKNADNKTIGIVRNVCVYTACAPRVTSGFWSVVRAAENTNNNIKRSNFYVCNNELYYICKAKKYYFPEELEKYNIYLDALKSLENKINIIYIGFNN